MRYEPIKALLGKYCKGKPVLRKALYFLMDILLLRAWHIRKMLRKISKKLPPDASVLDAGSGMGQYCWRLGKMGKNYTIRGIDINSSEVDDCNEFFSMEGLSGRISCETGDLTALNETGRYDFIITVDVMEHIADDTTVFRNFFMALSDKGILLISTPSDQGGSDAHDSGDQSFIDEHVRNGYGIGEIRQKLLDAGFATAEAHYTYGWPGNLSWKLSMKYPVTMLNRSWLFFILLPFWYVVFFPLALVLNMLDTAIKHNKGTGLLVVAQKRG